MNKRNKDQYMMMLKVKHLFNDNSNIWSGVPILATAFNEFQQHLLDIEQAQLNTGLDLKGFTETKAMQRKPLEAMATLISKRLVSYIQINNQLDLLSSVKFSATDFQRMKGKELIGACHNLHQETTQHIANLAPFLITPIVITNFLSLIDAFNQQLNAPKEKRNQVTQSNATMRQSVTDALRFLKESMDYFIFLIQESHSFFLKQYQNARNIDNIPTRRRALEIACINTDTSEPIVGAKIEIIDTKIKRTSGKKGKSYVQNLAEGNYQIKVLHPDFAMQMIDIVIVAKERTVVVVEM